MTTPIQNPSSSDLYWTPNSVVVECEFQITATTPQGVSLADARRITEWTLRTQFKTKFFVPTFTGSDQLTSPTNQKKAIRKTLGDTCVVCGMSGDANKNPNPVSIAHLLKNKADCEEASTVFYSPDDHSNWILLCGTEGDGTSCRGQFDKFRMTFRHMTDSDLTRWMVIGGGGRHGRTVKIPSKPHRRVLHAHLAHCVLIDTLVIPQDYEDATHVPDYRNPIPNDDTPKDIPGYPSVSSCSGN